MSLTNSPFWMAQTGTGALYDYEINNSVRMESADSSYLQRTPSVSGNQDTWTFSCWLKRTRLLGGGERIFGAGADLVSPGNHNNTITLYFDNHNLRFIQESGGSANMDLKSSAVYRDVSAWYHIVAVYDSTNATSGDRARMYVNGERITDLSINDPDPGSGTDSNCMRAGHVMRIGRSTSGYHNHNLAEVHWVDGSALEPTSFGETKSGVWIPKEYSGSHGTNGVYLKFANSAAFGTDSSGNGNTFSTGGLSTWDQLPDSPTNNFNVGMWLDTEGPGTLIDGALRSYVTSQGNYYSVGTSMGVKGGKWYYESRRIRGGNNSSGLPSDSLLPEGRYCNVASDPTGRIAINIGTQDGSDGIYMTALDLDNGYVYRGRNGSWSNGATASGISSGSGTGAVKTLTSTEIDQYLRLAVTHRHDTGTSNCLWNFGQDSTFENYTTAGGNSDENGYGDFKYSVPTNFLAMCSQNMPAPAIDPADGKESSDYFNTVLYAGNGNTGQSITGVGFQPDFLWVKNRNMAGGYPHLVRDVVRGVTKRLRTNSTDAEETANTVSSFDSDGFTFAPNQGNSFENDSAGNYVSWNWKAGGTAVTNNDGSQSCSVSANADSGFSVVKWTASAASGTLGHGLSTAPDLIIAKPLASSNWFVQCRYGMTAAQVMNLESTSGAYTPGYAHFQSTLPTSSVFYYGGYLGNGFAGTDKVAYCFSSVDGYCKVGSYTGGGDGTYIYTGFKPAFVMVKNYNTSSHHWVLYDNKRNGYNTIGPYLYANLTSVESNATRVDLLSNGFVGRVSNYDIAQSGVGFIYIAFAENPFKYANAG